MDNDQVQMIIENEREWRQYMIEKLDRIDNELSTFKIRVFSLASIFGGGAGLSADYIKNLFS